MQRFATSGDSAIGPRGMIQRLFARKIARKPVVPPARRIYAIGDVHGRLDLLVRLLGLIRQDQRARVPIDPEIVMLGDLIDRGPDSAGVVRLLMEPPGWARFTTLMGNHEAAMLEALQGSQATMKMWLGVGGRPALESWGVSAALLDGGTIEAIRDAALAAVPRAELAWISRLRQNVHIGDYFFVHAGVRPGVELDQQSPRDSYWIRDEFLESRKDHGAVVVHGHSIAAEVEDMGNRIGIDTGAYATGRLTAIGLEGGERWFLQT